MSDTNPKPGKQLEEIMKAISQLEFAIEREGQGHGKGAEECLQALLARFHHWESTNPDQIKFLMDRLNSASEAHQQQSDNLGHIAMMLADSANQVLQKLVTLMQAGGIKTLAGSTWKADLLEMDGKFEVDYPAMSQNAPEYFMEQKSIIMEKVTAALKAGTVIPGVTVHKVFEIDFAVIKKVKA